MESLSGGIDTGRFCFSGIVRMLLTTSCHAERPSSVGVGRGFTIAFFMHELVIRCGPTSRCNVREPVRKMKRCRRLVRW